MWLKTPNMAEWVQSKRSKQGWKKDGWSAWQTSPGTGRFCSFRWAMLEDKISQWQVQGWRYCSRRGEGSSPAKLFEGLCWVMKYYYSGCASWHWFYPFQYALFVSDLVNIAKFTISCDLGQTFPSFRATDGCVPSHKCPCDSKTLSLAAMRPKVADHRPLSNWNPCWSEWQADTVVMGRITSFY